MFKNGTNKLGVKLPRKVKKVYTSCFPERSYNKIYKRMSIRSNINHVSTLFKILDYVYYVDDKAIGEGRGFRPSWSEIVNHILYKTRNEDT